MATNLGSDQSPGARFHWELCNLDVRIWEIFPCGIQNPDCWNPDFSRLFTVTCYETKMAACISRCSILMILWKKRGIANSQGLQLQTRNPLSCWPLESGIQNKESGIQYLKSGIHSIESRIQDCPGLPYLQRCRATKLQNWLHFGFYLHKG